ncbi:MAG: ATP-dependent DNA helicase [Halothiobacillaceae bacterium]|nr:ATP-dependent DNA helicase [Halothiobacillaceae bacterium]MDY0050700.1 ATP-dependent DNA helicase [Halothiobacillaceae bacterium]
MSSSRRVEDWLGDDGPFAEALSGFAPRAVQQRMAALVDEALRTQGTLVVEAGTGVGKTFAYLLPALLSGRKVLVSTGTKHLQDQLFSKDIPLVRRVLGRPVDVALLKGRANYLCPWRLQRLTDSGQLRSREYVEGLQRVRFWAAGTRSGDIGECESLAEDHPLWPMVTSTSDTCLGSECPELENCPVMKARRRAQEADVVVVNHHLFFADLALREEGFAELLPHADAVILDEAHQLPEVAAQFFGESLSARQLMELARDSVREQLADAPDMPDMRDRAAELEKAVQDLRLAFGDAPLREAWATVAERPVLVEALGVLDTALAQLQAVLEVAAVRGKGLANACERCRTARSALSAFLQPEEGVIQWYELFQRGFSLNLTPQDVAAPFQRLLKAGNRAWVFASATLATGPDFGYFTRRLGIVPDHAERLDSPFDYAANALLYVPTGLPEPSSPGYTQAVLRAALPVLEASRGRAFLLFTSHRALREAETWLSERLSHPLLVQGSLPKHRLIERFRELGNAVLLGTQSFWEGVDVRGEALSCVIIDKLPFASPDDPVLRGRMDAIRQRGGQPFVEYQLPQAVITLKQGVGRLIRDVNDRGVLMLCDPRLLGKSYGRVFLNALPPMPLTRSVVDVRGFFAYDE